MKQNKFIWAILLSITTLSGCASITNDSHIPISFAFSDGSTGTCTTRNKRQTLEIKIPSTAMVRRSDDDLVVQCKTDDGRLGLGSIESTMGSEFGASVVFLDLGLVDSITDKHRYYKSTFIIDVPAQP